MKQKNRNSGVIVGSILVITLLIIGVALCLYGTGKIGHGGRESAKTAQAQRTPQQKELEAEVELKLLKAAYDAKERIRYFQDPQTNLCFALLPAPRTDVTASFTNVPCEAVPKDLLTLGRVPD